MKEYEYSFKVTDIKPYINYCKNRKYKILKEENQTRIIYKNINKTIARLTTSNNITVLDFKDDLIDTNNVLKISTETKPLEVNDNNKEAIESILKLLKYEKNVTLIRTRIVYNKDDVTFEIDSYASPEVMCVVGIEGKKCNVDKVYQEISDIRKETQII